MEQLHDITSDIPLLQRLNQLEPLVGHTPLYPLSKVYSKGGVQIFAKLEWLQMGHSVKTRPAYNIIRQAVVRGDIGNGKHLLDASSGNTAVALAAISTAIGIAVTLVVPENISSQKAANLKALGAHLMFSSKYEGTDGAQDMAKELATDYPERYWYADQYNNEDNWKAHYQTTGPEIFEQLGSSVTHFVAGLGTTGTYTGTTRKLRELIPNLQAIALQPDTPMHALEGWKHMDTAKVPGIYDTTVVDGHHVVSSEAALEMVRKVAREEGLVLSPSAAANLSGAMAVADQLNQGVIVTVFPDAGYNYPGIMKDIIT